MSKNIQSFDHEVVQFDDVMVEMRDGTRLGASITFPAKDGKADLTRTYPVLLVRTGYRMDIVPAMGAMPGLGLEEFATTDGYVYIVMSIRGTPHSEGTMHPAADEGWGQDGDPDRGGWGVAKDGLDAIDWVRKQPWCNGQIVTAGISWLGAAQLLPWLTDNNLPVETSFILSPAVNSGRNNWCYQNGFFCFKLMVAWCLSAMGNEMSRYMPSTVAAIHRDEELVGKIPMMPPEFVDMANRLAHDWVPKVGMRDLPILRHMPFWRKVVENRDNMDFFAYNETSDKKHAFARPLLFMSGYNDPLIDSTVEAYEAAVRDAPTPVVADGHRLVLTPYAHNFARISDDLELMKSTMTDFATMIMAWNDRQLRGEACDVFDKGRALLFIQGEEKWRAEKSWPIVDTCYTQYYLHSGGHANTNAGDGTLSVCVPGDESVDTYAFDPGNPAPFMYDNDMNMGGYGDVSSVETREDMLVFTTPVLEEDVEVTGRVKATLYASTSGTDTDFVVRLVDVFPDGAARHLTVGGWRGRYRNGRRSPEPLVPGQIERIEVPMQVTSCMFKKGHRIRVEVCSSAAYLWDVNPNAYVDLNNYTFDDMVVADQTIYHDAEHPSSITLPIVPSDHEAEWLDWPFETSKTGGIFEGETWMPGFDFSKTVSRLQRTVMPDYELPRVD